MTLWRDTLKPGSWRGVPFLFDAADTDVGRRVVTFEYPFRDRPSNEDLGKKADGFSLTVFVLGPEDYASRRDALIRAFRKGGPGRLVHPLFGDMTVVCTSCKVSERTSEGGKATFSLQFVEDGPIRFEAAAVHTGNVVASKAEDAIAAAKASFASRYKTAKVAPFVKASALSDLRESIEGLQRSAAKLIADPLSAFSFGSEVSATLADAKAAFGSAVGLAATVSGFVRRISFLPSDLGGFQIPSFLSAWTDQFARSPSGLGMSQASLAEVRRAQLSIADLAPSHALPAATTPSRLLEAENRAALYDLLHHTALSEAACAIAGLEFASADEALSVRDDLADRLDTVIETSADDDAKDALGQLRLAMIRDIDARAVDLPRLASIEMQTSLPAIVLAHRLYDDPGMAEDIVARNRIRHPGFVPGSQKLQVVTNA